MMELSDWTTLPQLVAALAVVISVLYLARQVSHAARVARAESTRDDANSMTYFRDLQNADNRRIHARGIVDFANLTREEQFHFHCVMFSLIYQAVSVFYDSKAGLFEKHVFSAW